MSRPRRLILLLIPLSLSVLMQALPGRAQQAPSVRYAFADTTLLRDTLNLSFGGLFPLADSLELRPDTLRALMIRYRYTMPRLLHLSDSLGMTVDSVGVFMERQKLNPLAGGGSHRTANSFTYTSGYDIQRTTSTWTNGSQYRVFRGPLYMTNSTNIEMQRIKSGGLTSLRQNREATTEGGLTVSKGLSFGARSYQLRFFSADPGATVAQDETKSEYGFTARGLTTGKRVNTELNLRTGYLDDKSALSIKRGLSGSADGRVRYANPGVLTHDLSGSFSGNLSRTRPPNYPIELNTHDMSSNVRGNLVLLPNSPVRLNVNYGLRNTRVEALADTFVNRILNRNNSADATLRMRADADRYLDLNASAGRTVSVSGTNNSAGGHATVRWLLMGWAVDANYTDSRSTAIYKRQRGGGGYDEHGTNRSADTQMLRNFGGRIIGKLLANVALDRYRYVIHSDSATQTPRDSYRQSYRTEIVYNPSQRLSSGVALQVSLNRTVNILATTTSSNLDTRSYRTEWRWSYRVSHSLTVTQNNQIQADYQQYPFSPSRNTLALSYNNTTALAAALPGGLSIDVQHNASQAPRGSYTVQTDGGNALQLSDDTENYLLSSSVRYSPFAGISLHIDPRYLATDRSGTTNGVQARQRSDKRLDFSGGVDVNWHVGQKGMLTGRIGRTLSAQRTTSYAGGVPTISPRAETDFWNGNLQLTWTL
jgi:hypothetical protein